MEQNCKSISKTYYKDRINELFLSLIEKYTIKL